MPELVTLGEFQSRRDAEGTQRRFANELQAELDPATDTYLYLVNGTRRRLFVVKSDTRSGWWSIQREDLPPE